MNTPKYTRSTYARCESPASFDRSVQEDRRTIVHLECPLQSLEPELRSNQITPNGSALVGITAIHCSTVPGSTCLVFGTSPFQEPIRKAPYDLGLLSLGLPTRFNTPSSSFDQAPLLELQSYGH
ncbi:hypothetical protein PMIN06_001854 [Paraphaeosphaeria minitans]